MKATELRHRVERYIRGDCRVVDLDRIFLGLRDRCYGLASIREIGDFVAHREQREKGPVTDKVRDIQLSLESWLKQGEGKIPDLAAAKRISAANLRTATDAQLAQRLGLRREVVKSVLAQAIKKMESDRFDKMTQRERAVFNYLAAAFIWNPAFTDEQVAEDLATVLIKAGALLKEERNAFNANHAFLALYVTALMHDSAVVMDDGSRFELVAGFANKENRIEVKARIELAGWGKPVTAPVCVFWTKLICSEDLAAMPGAWSGAIEIDLSGRLTSFA
jgi:dsDNA-binding SOS-regulon protein